MYAIRSYYADDADTAGLKMFMEGFKRRAALGFNTEMEGTAPTLRAFKQKFSAHLVDQGGADRQTQTCRITSYNVCYTKLLRYR